MAQDDEWPEIYDEIDRLPATYRLPVVLCVLEGRTRTEAAAQLGWTEGLVRGRLGRAKELLRSRLVRRGFAPAVALAALRNERAHAEIVPRALIERTACSASRAAVGSVSASAAALCQEVLRTMFMTRLKLGAVALLAAGGIGWGIAGVTATQDQQPAKRSSPVAGARPGESAIPPATQAPVQPNSGATVTVRVLDPDGKPAAGAAVYRVSAALFDEPWTAALVTRTGPDGSFRLSPDDAKTALDGKARLVDTPDDANAALRKAQFVVTAEGCGPAFVEQSTGDGMKVLHLVKDDVPIRGRVIDLQGLPVAGATIEVVGILWCPSGNLDEWLSALKTEKAAYPVQDRMLRSCSRGDFTSIFPAVTADREGRFTLRGIGRERIARLLVSGPRIETRFEFVVTRDMPAVKVAAFDPQNDGRDITYHGASFDLVGGPGLELVGTVRERDTGKALAGITVQTTARFGNPSRYNKTTTDIQGAYRLSGVPPQTEFGAEQDVLAAPKDGPPYVPEVQHVGGGHGPGPIRIDFALKRGAWARGRVIDKSTGKPVAWAWVSYYILEDNPHLKDYLQYGTVQDSFPFHAGENGEFKIAVLPGRGILGARFSFGNGTYRYGVGIDKIRGLKASSKETVLARPRMLEWRNFNTLVEVDPKEGEASITTDIVLDRGRTLKVKLVGPDGEPVAGALMMGAEDRWEAWSDQPLPSADFEVHSLGSDAKRGLLFYHEAKQLAGAYVIKPDEASPVTVRLEPCGALTGRLVDAGGLPQAGAQMNWYRPMEGGDSRFENGSLPSPIKTDKDGRFRVAGLIPGLTYSLYLTKGRVPARWPVKNATIKAGEVKELGNVKAVD